jgi:hypothetical protein
MQYSQYIDYIIASLDALLFHSSNFTLPGPSPARGEGKTSAAASVLSSFRQDGDTDRNGHGSEENIPGDANDERQFRFVLSMNLRKVD